VKVVIRCRPMSKQEIIDARENIVEMNLKDGVGRVRRPGTQEFKDFTFDAVYDDSTIQTNFYDQTGYAIVESVMDGYNGTIFAYGQTGTGKTHTMVGPPEPEEMHGVIPRTFSHIFNNINMTPSKKFLVRASYLEIYNEEIRDLLSKNPKAKLELKDHPDGGVFVKDLSNLIVKGVNDLRQVMEVGQKNRSVASTKMNNESSRSHSIFTITIETAETGTDAKDHIRVGKMNMVDLAGSERQSKTGASGETLKEATKINMSLSALGNVISALVDSKSSFIPYRDSKLTRLLQDSLGGNTKTVMCACIGPVDYNYDETLSTLRYAYRAKSIKNKPKINEDPKDAMIREFQDEIMRLKAELLREGPGGEPGEAGAAEEEEDEEPEAESAAPAPLPPRIEKQVEYVEKIVEKTIEREVVVEQGLRPEDVAAMEAKLREQNDELKMKAEAERRELATRRNLAESERNKLATQIDEQEKAAMLEQRRKAELENKLRSMEEKMMVGKKMMEQAIVQEEELKRQQRKLKKQQEKEALLRERENQQRHENEELESKCHSQEEQIAKLTSKLQKLWDKCQKAQQEMVDVQQFNQGEREEMLEMIRELRRELKLKTLIMESFVPMKEVQNTHDRAFWDAEEDEWKVQPAQKEKENRPVKPGSAFGLPRPTSEFARITRAMGDPNPRYMYDSIVMTDLDLPERTTEDFEVHPELGDRIERALMLALSPEEEEVSKGGGADDKAHGNGRPRTGSRTRPQSGRPVTGRKHEGEAAFPQARGLVSRE